METAFVLVTREAGTTGTVTKKIQMIYEIKEVTPVWGAYDIIIKITAPTMEILKDTIRQKIRTADNVRTTVSLLLTESTT